MALGDAGNGRDYGIPYYSRFNLTTEDRVLKLQCNFKGGLLNLNIAENTGSGYKYDARIFISLSPKKAKILQHQIEAYMKDKNEGRLVEGMAYSVDTGIKDTRPTIGLILKDGKDQVLMGKIGPDGTHEAEYLFPINTGYHYGIKWQNYEQNKFEKQYYDELEIELLLGLLKEFCDSSYGAQAAATWDMVRVDPKGLENVLTSAASKLGVEFRKPASQGQGSSNSFFSDERNVPQGKPTTKSSLEDMEDLE